MRATSLGQSFACAAAGWRYAFSSQRNVRIHCTLALLCAGAGIWLRLSSGEWALLALTITLVIAIEIINTAIETLVDLASPEIHPLAGRAKDLAAAAVLTVSAAAVLVGLLVFGRPLVAKLMPPAVVSDQIQTTSLR